MPAKTILWAAGGSVLGASKDNTLNILLAHVTNNLSSYNHTRIFNSVDGDKCVSENCVFTFKFNKLLYLILVSEK